MDKGVLVQEFARRLRSGMDDRQQEYFNRVFTNNESPSAVRGEMNLPDGFEEDMLRDLRGARRATN